MIKYLFLAIATIFSFSTINAQHAGCGVEVSPEEMQKFYHRDRSHLENNLKGTKAIVNIPITYHLVADDNGNGAFTISEALALHCSLVEDFVSAEINFYIKDIVSHSSDYYFYMTDGTNSGSAMFQNENDPTSCNIFIVREANTGSAANGIGPVCGYSYLAQYGNGQLINRNGIMLDQQCVGPGSSTLTHEMGHYLNLPHTFSGWEGQDYNVSPIPTNEWERVDGSNCTYRGDGFCDTPPDYISYRWDCFTSVNIDDAVGQNFIVDEKNFMSYSSDGCAIYFKQDQEAEMNAAPSNYRSYLLSDPVPNLNPVSATQIEYPEDFDANLSANSITFTWEEMLNAEYYLVQFTKSTFNNIEKEIVVATNEFTRTDLDLGETYRWRVKAFSYGYACVDYSDTKTFSTSTFTLDVDVQDVFCQGDVNGSALVNSSVAGNAYQLSAYDEVNDTYNLLNSTSSNSFNTLAPNDYEIIVITNTGEQSISYFTVNDAEEIEINLSISGSSISSSISGGTPPYNYTWSNGSGFTNNSNPNDGENSLYITDANGCFKSASVTFTPEVSPISDVEKLDWNVSIYPNPLVGNTLYVSIDSENKEEAIVDIFSIDGKRLISKNASLSSGENLVSIDMSSASKGVYVLRTTVGKNTEAKKVIL